MDQQESSKANYHEAINDIALGARKLREAVAGGIDLNETPGVSTYCLQVALTVWSQTQPPTHPAMSLPGVLFGAIRPSSPEASPKEE